MAVPRAIAGAGERMKGVVLPLVFTLAVQALTSMAMIGPTVMAPVAAPELGVSPQGIGWFVAAAYLFAMLSGLACGALIGRFGPVHVCQISVCLAAAAPAAQPAQPPELLQAACRCLWRNRCAKT